MALGSVAECVRGMLLPGLFCFAGAQRSSDLPCLPSGTSGHWPWDAPCTTGRQASSSYNPHNLAQPTTEHQSHELL
jgi:hypothetical protein